MALFKRLGNLFRGLLFQSVSHVEKRNPEALLEVEKENLRTQIARYNEGLAAHAGLCERLMAQVKKLEQDERELKAKTTANLRAGNRDLAAQAALRFQANQRNLEDGRQQLAAAEETYKTLIQSRDVAIAAARQKLDSLKNSIDDMKVKKAMAEMTEMASGMITQIGGSGDTLNRLTEMVEDERSKAAGRTPVARDSINHVDLDIKEAEQKALADQALADFAAKEGIALDAPPTAADAAPAAPKRMGPIAGSQS